MTESLEELMRSYKEIYSQDVRDLAETFCGSTTRMGGSPERSAPPLTQEVRREAAAHGVAIHVLISAVAHYTRIEVLAEARQRSR